MQTHRLTSFFTTVALSMLLDACGGTPSYLEVYRERDPSPADIYDNRAQSNKNCYIESFKGKFRDECLNEHWFSNLQEARKII